MQALLRAISQLDFPTNATRVFHGRGGRYPGSEAWALDAFPPVWVVTHFSSDRGNEIIQIAEIGTALEERWNCIAPGQPLNWVFQRRTGGGAETLIVAGTVPEPHVVTEEGVSYRVHVGHGQNHGLFLDMAVGREWVRTHVTELSSGSVRGPNVLNLFAYTCAFSVVAMQAGARQVINVDMARAAMTTGQQNHQLNGVKAGARFLVHDIFSTWGKIGRGGPYDLVIVDPPSHQKGSFIATKDYARIIRRLAELLAPGGHALLCLNAPELGQNFLHHQMTALAPELKFVQRLANPGSFADVDDERALKVLVYRAPKG